MAYLLGLQRLGHEVYLFEEVEPGQCWDAGYRQVPFRNWVGREHFEQVTQYYGLWPRCCLIFDKGRETHGLSFCEAAEVAHGADLLLDLGATLRTPEIVDAVRCRAYVDEAPGKTQVYHAEYGIDQGFDGHQFFFSVGLNVGTAACEVPTAGVPWHGIVHPVVLGLWPARIDGGCRRFTTISNWSEKETFDLKGRYSGEKSDNWTKFFELPQKTGQELEVALNVPPGYEADRELFSRHGWFVEDPKRLRTFEDYREYIAASRAEFSIANNRYVEFNTGWTSDRTARYLASGKPALVQATGIESHLPVGKGLLTFSTLSEALAGIKAINAEYEVHCLAARRIAEEFFNSEKVLGHMLKVMGC